MVTKQELIQAYSQADDKEGFIEALRAALREVSPQKGQPIDSVRWVPLDKVQANDYNPNSVAENEMRLLHTSISHDGYTQPVVTIYDPELDKYVIVDGFHRYSTMLRNPDIQKSTGGLLPVVVIDKPINDRMASTVRHNRARGKHAINGMAQLVFSMLDNGWSDAAICHEIGLEIDELLRLKSTGFGKLFTNVEYKRAWEAEKQVATRIKHAPKISPEIVAERRQKLESHFENIVKKTHADYTDCTCPGCGEKFYIAKEEVRRRPVRLKVAHDSVPKSDQADLPSSST